jgi:hypothetical protein
MKTSLIGQKRDAEKAVRTWIVALVGLGFLPDPGQIGGKGLVRQGFLRIIEGFAGFAAYVTSV